MIIKKFQAGTETEAIMMAKDDLGKDAIVMNIKTIKPKGLFKIFRKTQVEVTAAVDETSKKEGKTEKTADSRTASSQFNAKIDEKLHPELKKESDEAKEAKELEEKLSSLAMLLEQQLESQKNEEKKTKEAAKKEEEKEKEASADEKKEDVVDKAEVSEKDSLKNKSVDLIIEQLTGNEVTYAYAKQIIDEISHSGNIRTLDDMLAGVYQKLILKLGEMKPISFDEEDKKPKVIFFVGPTGVGKTTTIAKLSSKLILEEKKKIAIFTSDTYRIAAVEQIKTYANILSIPVEIIYEVKDLDTALPKYKSYDYVLVDTAGRSHKNKEQIDDLKNLFNAFSQYSILTYLVLSATTKYKDLKKITALYEDITECSLIFTKLDETDAIGNILNLKLDTGMSLSYVSYGQNVPDDIEVLNPQIIAKKLLGGGEGYGSGG
ncbi:MAG: flagellar biosynthesis protein FlhF [Bacteroidales bacterium]|nr:flagellar biosynthesis protein FlhF [Clostridium sp.]MCM1202743.1 flagellar biosynthesis protein FlhF [Bacteroidales bacterium]